MADVNTFLKLISALESSGGKNLDHKTVEEGIHAGDTAVGQYGILPNTALEMANRRRLSNTADDFDRQLLAAPKEEVEAMMKNNPEAYRKYAEDMARNLLQKTNNDVPTSAAGWLYGHNLSAEKMQEKLQRDPAYQKRIDENFKKIKSGLGK